MTRLEWKPEYEIGVAAIDHEHRQLIELIDSLCASAEHTREAGAVADALGEVHAQICAHFALEEKLMRDRGYAAHAEHKADHERLLDEIREIMDDCEDGGEAQLARLPARLDAWFSVHFRSHDARLHRQLG